MKQFVIGITLALFLTGFTSQSTNETAVPVNYNGRTYEFNRGTAYLAQVLKVKDGDTFDAAVSIWNDLVVTKTFRVRGIDTAEKNPRKKDHLGRERTEEARQKEREDSAKATYWAERLLMGKGLVYIGNIDTDNFGRVLAEVYVEDDRRSDGSEFVSFATVMIERGLAVPYFGGDRNTWGVTE